MKVLPVKMVKAKLILSLVAIGLLIVNAPATAVTVGEMAPDFEVTTQDGDAFRLSDFRGKSP